MIQPSVFEYTDPIEYLGATLQYIQRKNPQFSLRAWSQQLGMNHVAMLSMVLNRKRKLLPNLSSKISTHFLETQKFKENEARYFDILVLFHNARTLEEKNFFEGILSSLKPSKDFSTLELDRMRFISEWYHVAILEMTELKNFKSDPRWICLRLGDSVTISQVQAAIDRLERLGLLERDEKKGFRKTHAFLATPTDVADESLKRFHSEFIRKSGEAIRTQSVEKRDITSFTFSIDETKIPEAKRMIRDFRRKLGRYLAKSQGDSVYQLNIQLFDLLAEEK